MTREKQIIAAARSYLGVPFQHQGRSRLGLDCLGLLVCIARDCNLRQGGVLLSECDETTYGHYPDAHDLKRRLELVLSPCSSPALGSVVLLSHDGAARHLGIVANYTASAEEYSLIHAYAPARCVVEHRLDASWRKRIAQCYCIVAN